MIEKFDSSKERIIQEFVPGKQITLAHIIPNPVSDLYSKMGMKMEMVRSESLQSRQAKVRSLLQMWQVKPVESRSDLWIVLMER